MGEVASLAAGGIVFFEPDPLECARLPQALGGFPVSQDAPMIWCFLSIHLENVLDLAVLVYVRNGELCLDTNVAGDICLARPTVSHRLQGKNVRRAILLEEPFIHHIAFLCPLSPHGPPEVDESQQHGSLGG